MSLRERFDNEARPQQAATGSGGGDNLSTLRQAGSELLAAGDEAIRRALSGDSERFLQANRQQGGK